MAILKCDSCGVEKDESAQEIYPFEEDGVIETPIEPFFDVDVRGGGAPGEGDWRVARMCHQCFHDFSVDMWITEDCWTRSGPDVAFEQLRPLKS